MQIFKLKGVQDLPPKKAGGVSHLRPKIQICLVDDKAQKTLIGTLRNHGYNVTKFDDITRLLDVAEFPIVVTDIMGIGKNFGSSDEGWHVIKEMRRQYPLKHLIAYSAGSWDVSYSTYMENLDGFLIKDAPIEQWVELLDTGISATGDPIVYWKRCRDLLLKQGVSTSDVARLEDAFVRDVKSGKNRRVDRLWSKLEKKPQYSDIVPLLKPAMTMALGSLSVFADLTSIIPTE